MVFWIPPGFAHGFQSMKSESDILYIHNQFFNKSIYRTLNPLDKKLKIKSTTVGGPVADGVEYAKSKGDDLAGYRRTKDTRITKKLKKAGFTEDRLARLRKKHAEWKAKRKKKKKK